MKAPTSIQEPCDVSNLNKKDTFERPRLPGMAADVRCFAALMDGARGGSRCVLTQHCVAPVQTANVGDSAAVFCNSAADPREQFQKLTADHRISDPIEKQRLADLGIELGKNRTRLYGLNLSRCLGDKFIKGADLGFTAVPSVSEVAKLAPHESGMLVVASDGLWDVAEPGRVMEVRRPALSLVRCARVRS